MKNKKNLNIRNFNLNKFNNISQIKFEKKLNLIFLRYQLIHSCNCIIFLKTEVARSTQTTRGIRSGTLGRTCVDVSRLENVTFAFKRYYVIERSWNVNNGDDYTEDASKSKKCNCAVIHLCSD